jgi:hypothetical protein
MMDRTERAIFRRRQAERRFAALLRPKFAETSAPAPHGCICPPGSEKTCQGLLCPRRAIGSAT